MMELRDEAIRYLRHSFNDEQEDAFQQVRKAVLAAAQKGLTHAEFDCDHLLFEEEMRPVFMYLRLQKVDLAQWGDEHHYKFNFH